jgi:hypothetical protein
MIFVRAIRVVAAGDALMSASVTRKVIEGHRLRDCRHRRRRATQRADRTGT